MKILKQYIIRTVADETLLVPVGETAKDFNGMITFRGIGAFIWNNIELVESLDELVAKIIDEYEIDEKTAKIDAHEFVGKLLKAGMIGYSQDNW